MSKVLIVSRSQSLQTAIAAIHHARCLELVDASAIQGVPGDPPPPDPERGRRVTALRSLGAQLDGLLELAGRDAGSLSDDRAASVDVPALRRELAAVAPRVDELVGTVEALREERAVLPRYLEPMREVLELVPELARLDDADLRALGLDTVALVLATEDDALVRALRDELGERLGARRFELVAGAVQAEVVGCLLVFPHARAEEVHALLEEENVRHLPLPDRYERLSLRAAVAAMERRLEDLPRREALARAELDRVLDDHAGRWITADRAVTAELEQLEASALAAVSGRVFTLAGWVPAPDLPRLERSLAAALEDEVAVEVLPRGRADGTPPVLLRQPAPARPFESLVRLLDTPASRTLDPTLLMALFMPVMIGAMVGDIVYGAVLLALAVWARRRLGRDRAILRQIAGVLAVGAAWGIVFGVLYGEALGNAARYWLGMEPVWFYRGSPDALEPLLLFAVGLGAAHVLLGLVLGVWQFWRAGRPHDALDRLGTMLVLVGLFALAGIAADVLAPGTLPVAVAAMIVGLVLVLFLHGALAALTGGLELLGAVGNVLSYLRLAAVGLASVYLAIVANEFAVVAPAGVGIVVATLLHALNVALAALSPTVQALRLHYVEFFQKFLIGGGRPFRPFGATTPA
jgi:V/A-type H+-transporting ATPase subunit I